MITPYRQQIKLLTGLLDKTLSDVEILTADKSQGRDKECILVSLVRSNDTGYVSSRLLLSKQQLNLRSATCSKTGAGSTSHSLEQRGSWSSSAHERRWRVIRY